MTRRASLSTFQITTASSCPGWLMTAFHPARDPGPFALALTPSSMYSAITFHPRASLYRRPASSCREIETDSSMETLMRA